MRDAARASAHQHRKQNTVMALSPSITFTKAAALTAATALALCLVACSASEDAASSPSTSLAAEQSHGTEEHSRTYADHLEIADTWIKTAESGMTAAFGVITNTGDRDVVITGARSDAAGMVELHEVVDDVMRPVEGGFVVPAGESLTLEPGGLHIMFMDIPAAIIAGDEVTITLVLEDGSELEFGAVAKDFSGANEAYEGGMDMDRSSMEPSASALDH